MITNSSPQDRDPFAALGHQEKRVLLFLYEGRTDPQIARSLFLGEGTIRNYVNSLLSKLGLVSRGEAVDYARRYDLRGKMQDDK